MLGKVVDVGIMKSPCNPCKTCLTSFYARENKFSEDKFSQVCTVMVNLRVTMALKVTMVFIFKVKLDCQLVTAEMLRRPTMMQHEIPKPTGDITSY